MSNDFIRLPRSALELVFDPNVWQLYGYILLNADSDGTLVTSLRSLADKTGQSLQNIRTALNRLVSTQLVTQLVTHKLTQINLCGSVRKGTKPTQRPTQRPTQCVTQQSTPVAIVRESNMQDGFERFMEYFNLSFAGTSIPKIIRLTDRRKTALRTIFREYGKETVDSVLRKVYASDFLSGRKTEWHATFDWIFNKTNFQKILEDNYANGTNQAQQQSPGRGRRRNPDAYDLAREILGKSSD